MDLKVSRNVLGVNAIIFGSSLLAVRSFQIPPILFRTTCSAARIGRRNSYISIYQPPITGCNFKSTNLFLSISTIFTTTATTSSSIIRRTTLVAAVSKNTNEMSTSGGSTENAGCDDGVCVPLGMRNNDKSKTENTTTNDSDNSSSNEIKKKETRTKIKIDIISDTMCPWCWVGKRNLETALREMPEIDADINWLPFFLDRNLPEHGKPVKEYYITNYGDPMAGERMKPGLVKAGKKCGIDFETYYIHMTHYRPTIRSHRLIELAKQQNKQDEMVEELFHMYYEEGKHLNSIKDLTESAIKVGLEGDIEAYLQSDKDEKEVFAEADRCMKNAQGVPTFIFTRPGTKLYYTFSGGQPPSAFKQVFSMFSQN